jgi:hypothetical protein
MGGIRTSRRPIGINCWKAGIKLPNGVLWNHIGDANRNRLAELHPKAALETVKDATSPQPHNAYPETVANAPLQFQLLE